MSKPIYSVVACKDPAQGAMILCNGHPCLRTNFRDIPANEHNELALEICDELNRANQ